MMRRWPLSVLVFTFGVWMLSRSCAAIVGLVTGSIRSSRDRYSYRSARENKIGAVFAFAVYGLYGLGSVVVATDMAGNACVISFLTGLAIFVALRWWFK